MRFVIFIQSLVAILRLHLHHPLTLVSSSCLSTHWSVITLISSLSSSPILDSFFPFLHLNYRTWFGAIRSIRPFIIIRLIPLIVKFKLPKNRIEQLLKWVYISNWEKCNSTVSMWLETVNQLFFGYFHKWFLLITLIITKLLIVNKRLLDKIYQFSNLILQFQNFMKHRIIFFHLLNHRIDTQLSPLSLIIFQTLISTSQKRHAILRFLHDTLRHFRNPALRKDGLSLCATTWVRNRKKQPEKRSMNIISVWETDKIILKQKSESGT